MKRIFTVLLGSAGFILLLATCKDKNKDSLSTLTTHATLAIGSTIEKHTYAFVFSTDKGASYAEFASLKVGQPFQAKVLDKNQGIYLSSNAYTFDWTGSAPAPSDVATD